MKSLLRFLILLETYKHHSVNILSILVQIMSRYKLSTYFRQVSVCVDIYSYAFAKHVYLTITQVSKRIEIYFYSYPMCIEGFFSFCFFSFLVD
jgi:hypothetical protein